MDSPRAPNPDFERAVTDAVLSMPAARHLGFQVGRLAPGEAELVQPYRAGLTQHDGFVQGGVLGALADFAGGCAAGTLLPAGWANMTIDYTVKIVAPARGERIVARGRVIKAGPTISVAAADVYSVSTARGREVETLCATAFVTLRNIRVPDPRRGADR
ncbi:PaaI family thioesterase [Frankia sp. EAN1pec]|uniref:hotdog fold thioesterase n=1 Tax=Parafrankia sp. (strain EAN1pec) TaxID=298653 RepID=UPI0002E31B24